MSKQIKPPSAFRALGWFTLGLLFSIIVVCSGLVVLALYLFEVIDIVG